MVGLAYPALPALNREEMVRQQFFQGLSPDNKIEVRRIGLEYPISTLLPKLEEIERQKTEMMLDPYNPESHLLHLIYNLKLIQKILIQWVAQV